MSSPALPFTSRPIAIEEGWIDYNGHLNMAFYSVVADRGAEEAFASLGMGADYARTRRLTLYTAEAHVCFLRELRLGDAVRVTFQLIEADGKRLRAFQEIVHPEGWVAATCETLTLHIDMVGPKVAPFPPDIGALVEAMHAAHAALPVPPRAGKGIALARKG